ncbi:MAG: ATP-grasp domain-containing protein [Planctomycetota bacterium]
MGITWILERGVMADVHERLRAAAAASDQEVLDWRDEWFESWPRCTARHVVFHGSLGFAARVHAESPWTPGAFCDVPAFCCSSWYASAGRWLLHREWAMQTVASLVADPVAAFARFGSPPALFVRPDSPLKPFSGRVVRRDQVSLAALDHGFYFDDTSIAVILAPVRQVEREWRYVVVDGRVIAGSAYVAERRAPSPDDPSGEPWRFAQAVASSLPAPEIAYVLDVCSADGQLWLVELNPLSGADLYACDMNAVVREIAGVLERF